jgi:hypothetical protein
MLWRECREAPLQQIEETKSPSRKAPVKRIKTWDEIVTKRSRPTTPGTSMPPSPAVAATPDTAVPMEEDGLAPEEGELPDS